MTDKVNIRELVLGVLLAVTRDGEYSHIALKNTLDKYQYLAKQERSFLTRVCQGTLENMIWIDYCIEQFSTVKVNKMKPVIRTILRSSVYELKFMDSVPESATVNEAVKLAEKKGFRNLKGFVNGVLRNISRNLSKVKLPDPATDVRKYLSVRYSMPEWIVEELQEQYGTEQTEQILAAFLTDMPTGIRFNPARISREELVRRLTEEGVLVREIPGLSCGLYLSGYDHLESLTCFRQGLFYVQDISSMQVALNAEVKAGDHVLDVCAAPGGKSIHMAELLDGTGMVEARDLTPGKVALIRENIERCGLANIRAVQADARQLCREDEEAADIVIADLPCSGLGVIGRKADIKYKTTPQKQRELVLLQREILNVVSRYVKCGGTLMYSTCTINRAENEENVRWFLQEHAEFSLEKEELLLPKAGCQDGFYYARIRKKKPGTGKTETGTGKNKTRLTHSEGGA